MSRGAPGSGPVREARSCYDHLAGRLGTAVADVALDRGWVVLSDGAFGLTEGAVDLIGRRLGLDLRVPPESRRPVVLACRDWTEGRPHLAGQLGAALLDAALMADWVRCQPGTRALKVTSAGRIALQRAGIRGVTVDADSCDADNLCFAGAVTVTAAGAESWSDLVDRARSEGWGGLDTLGGHGGTVAEAVAANHASADQSVGAAVWSVRTWDLVDDAQRTFAAVDCEFRSGGSRFTSEMGRSRRYDVLEATFLLPLR